MSIQNDFGYKVTMGDNYIVREKIKDGKLILTVFRVKEGKEMRPLGFMQGVNYLEFNLE